MKDQVSDLLATAFEGGSNYWYEIQEFVEPEQVDFRCFTFASDPEPHRLYDYPLCTGGAVIISDNEGDPEYASKRLDLQSIDRGLGLLAAKYPQRMDNIVRENYDAEDADVFLQLALFGEVVFG